VAESHTKKMNGGEILFNINIIQLPFEVSYCEVTKFTSCLPLPRFFLLDVCTKVANKLFDFLVGALRLSSSSMVVDFLTR
jgi:hypothetical protein